MQMRLRHGEAAPPVNKAYYTYAVLAILQIKYPVHDYHHECGVIACGHLNLLKLACWVILPHLVSLSDLIILIFQKYTSRSRQFKAVGLWQRVQCPENPHQSNALQLTIPGLHIKSYFRETIGDSTFASAPMSSFKYVFLTFVVSK